MICCIGISGSGKTFYGNELQKSNPNIVVICPDDIRKKLTGDISNQNKNKEVFKIAYEDLKSALKLKKTVYFSATNLTKRSRKELIDICKKNNEKITFIIFNDSKDKDLCYHRICNDLSSGKDRSRVSEEIINKQYVNFMSFINNIDYFEKEELKGNVDYEIKFV